jgi:hypothetical protein
VPRGALFNIGPIKGCCNVSCCDFQLLWPDHTPLHLVKSRYLYQLLTNNNDIFAHVNSKWGVEIDNLEWMKYFTMLWTRPIEPKISCFLWKLFLHKLPFKTPGGSLKSALCVNNQNLSCMYFLNAYLLLKSGICLAYLSDLISML